MNYVKKLIAPAVLAAGFGCSNAMAGLVDLTHQATVDSLTDNALSGTVDGVVFRLTGGAKFQQGYDGDTGNVGCTKLACNTDGAGIRNDEISAGQTLGITFDAPVIITALYFLDLYTSQRGTEQATVSADGADVAQVGATQARRTGGYASIAFSGGLAVSNTLEFTAFQGVGLKDDGDNDFAFAGFEATTAGVGEPTDIPLPATGWLIVAGLAGLVARGRRALFSTRLRT